MSDFINVLLAGASGDGVGDDSGIINELISSGNAKLYFPDGVYLLSRAIELRSGTRITASPGAVLRLAPGAQKGRRDFLLTNRPEEGATEDVEVTGGVWDGNSAANDRGADLFDPAATSGALFSFRGVRNLTLSCMTLKNPLCYYMRFCEADGVAVENIVFDSEDVHINQDGIHLAGFCSRFRMRRLRGLRGSPGDDFIALNADDCLTRQESFDMINGPQRDILIEDVYADDCHCFVRLLSVVSPIEDVSVRRVSGSCRGAAVNMDAARYCRVPLFSPDDEICAQGVGRLKNVRLESFDVGRLTETDEPFIVAETNAEGLAVSDFRTRSAGAGGTVGIANLAPHRVEYVAGDKRRLLHTAQNERLSFSDCRIDLLRLDKE